MAPTSYDCIVIGAGQGGGPLATALANAGRRTAIIERAHVGGTCINEGCTPTKTMVASARVAYLARRSKDYGVETGSVTVNMERVRQRKRDIVESFRGGSERHIRAAKGLDLLMGEATFLDAHTVRVTLASGEKQDLQARQFFINAGARPSPSRVEGIEAVAPLNSTSIMELDHVPEHLIVLGGGYVGLEFGQMFRRFGAQVTVVQRGPRLLAREDGDVADAVAQILREDGVEILLESEPTRARRDERGAIEVAVKTPMGERLLHGSHVLAATGRVPNTEALGLAAAGVATDSHGFVTVNERLETTAPNIYAIGDVKGGPAFTHISYDDFRILRANLLEGGAATTTDRMIPYTVYIDPQLGRIGLSEEEARAANRSVRVAKMPMTSVARADEVDESRGFMKAIVDAQTQQILGCAVLGIEGGEIMSMLQIAMMGRIPYTVLKDATFAHPTLAESLNNLFGSFTT